MNELLQSILKEKYFVVLTLEILEQILWSHHRQMTFFSNTSFS